MTPDQIKRLKDRQTELCDVYLEESDPKTWPSMLTREGRGDRVWYKKNAIATLNQVVKIEQIVHLRESGGSVVPDDDDEAEKMVKEAEAEALAIIERHTCARKKSVSPRSS